MNMEGICKNLQGKNFKPTFFWESNLFLLFESSLARIYKAKIVGNIFLERRTAPLPSPHPAPPGGLRPHWPHRGNLFVKVLLGVGGPLSLPLLVNPLAACGSSALSGEFFCQFFWGGGPPFSLPTSSTNWGPAAACAPFGKTFGQKRWGNIFGGLRTLPPRAPPGGLWLLWPLGSMRRQKMRRTEPPVGGGLRPQGPFGAFWGPRTPEGPIGSPSGPFKGPSGNMPCVPVALWPIRKPFPPRVAAGLPPHGPLRGSFVAFGFTSGLFGGHARSVQDAQIHR